MELFQVHLSLRTIGFQCKRTGFYLGTIGSPVNSTQFRTIEHNLRTVACSFAFFAKQIEAKLRIFRKQMKCEKMPKILKDFFFHCKPRSNFKIDFALDTPMISKDVLYNNALSAQLPCLARVQTFPLIIH